MSCCYGTFPISLRYQRRGKTMIRALNQRSERTVLHLIFLTYLVILPVRVIKCDGVSENAKQVSVCDDGQTGIQEDLEDFQCHGDKYTITYDFPAGYSNCTEHTQEPQHVCMSSPIIYNTTPPSSGVHRMIWPCYGEYEYCPPQRWVHSLEHGAVVFLYHPCTPVDQVTALKRLAKSCLWRHIITSYPHLDQQYPMALVSWGCVYRMTWVDVRAAEEWIKQHALHSPETSVAQDGMYNHSLQHPAAIVSDADDNKICPKHHSTPTTTESVVATTADTPTPTGSTGNEHVVNVTTSSSYNEASTTSASNLVTKLPDEQNYATKGPKPDNQTSIETDSQGSSSRISVLALTLISGSLAVLLVLVMLCLLWRRYPPRKRYGRYKSFLPMSLQSDGGIAIPTIGLPRGNKAEAEILIPEDEDDEI